MSDKDTAGQLRLFPEDILCLSQRDAARSLGIPYKLIEYWEKAGLLRPEIPPAGKRKRRYTPGDLARMRLLKSLVVEQGYSVSWLKKKAGNLENLRNCNPGEILWDPEKNRWVLRSELALEKLKKKEAGLLEAFQRILLDRLPDEKERKKLARSILEAVGQSLRGKGASQ